MLQRMHPNAVRRVLLDTNYCLNRSVILHFGLFRQKFDRKSSSLFLKSWKIKWVLITNNPLTDSQEEDATYYFTTVWRLKLRARISNSLKNWWFNNFLIKWSFIRSSGLFISWFFAHRPYRVGHSPSQGGNTIYSLCDMGAHPLLHFTQSL